MKKISLNIDEQIENMIDDIKKEYSKLNGIELTTTQVINLSIARYWKIYNENKTINWIL